MKTLILSSLLCLMVAVESTVIKYVQKRQQEDIPSEQLVFLVEIFKLIISICIYVIYDVRNDNEQNRPITNQRTNYGATATEGTSEEEDPLERQGTSSILWFILPACLYAVSNNVTFAALMLMSPALFNLLMNLKIPMTGLMACALLHYKLTRNLGISFVFLFMGSIFATLKWDKDGAISIDGSIYGLMLMFVYAACSACAAVYVEYVTKIRYAGESINLQNIKFCVCSVVANIFLMLLRGVVPFTTLCPIHLASVAALGMNGLITAMVLKHGGAIIKTYSVSCAAFLSAVFTWFLFQQKLHWNFYVGGVICALSVNMYVKERSRQ